ncbi:hypothetical protein VTK56DRAFT_5428 [Thermocarpiscus australiensis]
MFVSNASNSTIAFLRPHHGPHTNLPLLPPIDVACLEAQRTRAQPSSAACPHLLEHRLAPHSHGAHVPGGVPVPAAGGVVRISEATGSCDSGAGGAGEAMRLSGSDALCSYAHLRGVDWGGGAEEGGLEDPRGCLCAGSFRLSIRSGLLLWRSSVG